MAATLIAAAVSGGVALMGQSAEKKAAKRANAATGRASDIAQARLDPYADAGKSALEEQTRLLYGYEAQDYDPNSIMEGYEGSEFYAHDQDMMNRSQEALMNKFAGQMGGNAALAMTEQAGRTSRGMARTYVSDVQAGRGLEEKARQQHLNNLSGVAANGQNAAGLQGTIGVNSANKVAANNMSSAKGFSTALGGFGESVARGGLNSWTDYKDNQRRGLGTFGTGDFT